MSAEAAAPGERATPDVPDGRPLALARPARRVGPAREAKASRRAPVRAEHVALLSAVRAATDRMAELEDDFATAVAVARDDRQRAVLAARREGIPLSRIGEHASRPGDPPLSRRQVNRLVEAQQPWKD